MATEELRGIEKHEEISDKDLYRDTRSLWQKIWDVAWTPTTMIVVQAVMFCLCLPVPLIMEKIGYIPSAAALPWPGSGAWIFFTVYCLLCYLVAKARHGYPQLPFRLPKHVGDVEDRNNPIPGAEKNKFFKASGILYVGHERLIDGGKELWLSCRDWLTHMLIFGTTGSGKTETLVGLSFNALAVGSGFFYVDPKAAPKLATQVYQMSRGFGRDDDFRVLNYLLGATNSQFRDSNNINPLAYGTAENLGQMINALIPSSEGGNEIFSQNAQNLGQSLLYAMVEYRDEQGMPFSIDVLRKHLTLDKCIDIAEDKSLSRFSRNAMITFLSSVGYQERAPRDKQPRSLPEQFGYARSYFGRPLAMLSDTYKFIYGTTGGEVDVQDVVLNRRILVTMLPSLEKAPSEMKQLGRVTLSAIRNAIVVGLGGDLEGKLEDTLQSLPTDSPTPFLSITDEYAAIVTEGYPEVLTQGRGLGIAAVIASQDLPGIKRGDEIGAQQIVSNSAIKAFMKLAAPDDTYELLKNMVGEASVMRTDGYHIDGSGSGLGLSYKDKRSAVVDRRSRVDFSDLQKQIEGETHWTWGGKLVRGHALYVPLPEEGYQQVRIARLVTVLDPKPDEVLAKDKLVDELYAKLEGNKTQHPIMEQEQAIREVEAGKLPKYIEVMITCFRKGVKRKAKVSVRDRAIATILMFKGSTDEHFNGVIAQKNKHVAAPKDQKDAQHQHALPEEREMADKTDAQRRSPDQAPLQGSKEIQKKDAREESGSNSIMDQLVGATISGSIGDSSEADTASETRDALENKEQGNIGPGEPLSESEHDLSAKTHQKLRDKSAGKNEDACDWDGYEKGKLISDEKRAQIIEVEKAINSGSTTDEEINNGIDNVEAATQYVLEDYPEQPIPEPATDKTCGMISDWVQKKIVKE